MAHDNRIRELTDMDAARQFLLPDSFLSGFLYALLAATLALSVLSVIFFR